MESRIGKFALLRLLGQGTMGQVYLARDEDLKRDVALKLIAPGNPFGRESRARFQREAQVLAALNHPNIVTLHDFGVQEDCDYLVMEYLEGEDLASLIARGLGKAEASEALAQACEGLAFAHARGIIHRDVKPGNIMVNTRHGGLQAKIMDFGIAHLDRSELTRSGSWMGTLGYMAPEYLDSDRATAPAGDLFAAGVILYEILSGGRRPFKADGSAALIDAILHLPPAPLDPEALAGVPDALLAVLDRALAKDPADRHATGLELARAIRQAWATPAAGPPRPGPPSALPEPLRRIVVGHGTGANCLSLRVALRQAQPGAVVQVLPGLYKEAVAVTRDVTLMGTGEASEVRILQGLTVEPGGRLTLVNATVENPLGVALVVLPGAQVEAEDSAFRDAPGGGVELGPGTAARFLRCRFSGNRCAGLLVMEAAQALLEDCDLSGNQDAGIHAAGGASLRVRASRLVENPGMGVSAVDRASVALDACELARNGGPGLLLDRGASGRLNQCRIAGNQSMGIACLQGAGLALEDCLVTGNAPGGLLLAPEAQPFTLAPGNRVTDRVIRG